MPRGRIDQLRAIGIGETGQAAGGVDGVAVCARARGAGARSIAVRVEGVGVGGDRGAGGVGVGESGQAACGVIAVGAGDAVGTSDSEELAVGVVGEGKRADAGARYRGESVGAGVGRALLERLRVKCPAVRRELPGRKSGGVGAQDFGSRCYLRDCHGKPQGHG